MTVESPRVDFLVRRLLDIQLFRRHQEHQCQFFYPHNLWQFFYYPSHVSSEIKNAARRALRLTFPIALRGN